MVKFLNKYAGVMAALALVVTTVTANSITTKMSLSGTFYKSNSSTCFSLNANKTNSYNDLSKSQSSYDSDAYVSLSTTTSSNDTAFGSCSYSTNGAFNGVF